MLYIAIKYFFCSCNDCCHFDTSLWDQNIILSYLVFVLYGRICAAGLSLMNSIRAADLHDKLVTRETIKLCALLMNRAGEVSETKLVESISSRQGHDRVITFPPLFLLLLFLSV